MKLSGISQCKWLIIPEVSSMLELDLIASTSAGLLTNLLHNIMVALQQTRCNSIFINLKQVG